MHIVIIGAGDIGRHVARVFSQAGHGVILIDHDPLKLEKASRHLDIATRLASGTDWEVLEEYLEYRPDFFIAVTGDDETNLVGCSLAKHLGYPQTIARIRARPYFLQSRLNIDWIFCVDHLIGPEKLTAQAIENLILIPDTQPTHNFANGSIQCRTLKIPNSWKKEAVPIKEVEENLLPKGISIALIAQTGETKEMRSPSQLHFPSKKSVLKAGDEVTFIGNSISMRELPKAFGIPSRQIESAVIVGASLVALHLISQLLEHEVHIRLIEHDFEKCRRVAEKFPTITVIYRDGTDFDLLRSEKIEDADVFVACTRSDQTNFLAASLAKEIGCQKVIVSLSDTSFFPLMGRLGIDYATSSQVQAADKILSISREKMINSMVSMYQNQAEIMEVKVSTSAKVTGIPMHLLKGALPSDFLIPVIQSRGKILKADSSCVISPKDTVMIVSRPDHIEEIKELF